MKRILTSIALIASLGTAQAAGPEDVLLGFILGAVIGQNSRPQAPVVVHQPPVIFQPQPQIIYAPPPPPRPVCDHYPVYDHYGYHRGWRTHCR